MESGEEGPSPERLRPGQGLALLGTPMGLGKRRLRGGMESGDFGEEVTGGQGLTSTRLGK